MIDRALAQHQKLHVSAGSRALWARTGPPPAPFNYRQAFELAAHGGDFSYSKDGRVSPPSLTGSLLLNWAASRGVFTEEVDCLSLLLRCF